VRRGAAAVLALLLSACAAGAASGGGSPAPPCRAKDMQGRFAVIPGSAGAGNIVYALTLTNRSDEACSISGLPRVRLLGRRGLALPTHVVAARPGEAAVLVTLRPGARARATARFSPDVPGRGEPADAPCQRTAARLRVRLAGGGLLAPIVPPTRVCSRGLLQFSVYRRVP
jgi:hypothetical protein